jgi:hypothetical protein
MTRFRTSSRTLGWLLITRETVERETPALPLGGEERADNAGKTLLKF